MKTWMSAALLVLWSSVSFGAAYPTFTAFAKHPVGGGRYMLVIPGYSGLPVYVNAADQVVAPPTEILAAPSNWVRLSDGGVVYSPQPVPSPIRINPQPAFIVIPGALRTAKDGPPRLGP